MNKSSLNNISFDKASVQRDGISLHPLFGSYNILKFSNNEPILVNEIFNKDKYLTDKENGIGVADTRMQASKEVELLNDKFCVTVSPKKNEAYLFKNLKITNYKDRPILISFINEKTNTTVCVTSKNINTDNMVDIIVTNYTHEDGVYVYMIHNNKEIGKYKVNLSSFERYNVVIGDTFLNLKTPISNYIDYIYSFSSVLTYHEIQQLLLEHWNKDNIATCGINNCGEFTCGK